MILLMAPDFAVSYAAVVPVDDLAAEQMSVRELMRMETELALSRARKALHKEDKTGPDIQSGNRYGHSGALKLVAIYGVGKKLLAEVMIGAQPHVYMRGQALPVGTKSNPSAYMLRGISGSCVQLERKDEAHTLCLPPSFWTVK